VGAAGIYSNLTPYREKVTHGETGYLCPHESDKWVAAITQLLSDGELRTSIYLKARDWCAETCSSQTV
jgi:glycosyltransferase involved in cell wall biosynthesis